MAAKKNREMAASNGNGGRKEEKWAVPDGFNITVGRERGDGWVKKEEGNTVLGRLMGRHTYQSRGKKRAYYQIRLHDKCVCEVENPEYDEENADRMEEEGIAERLIVTLGEGSIVNVDETAKLGDLESRVGDGGVYDIWFVYGKKEDIGNGQTMWNVIGPKLKMVEKPREIP